jgi:hypothetical protein
VHDIVLGRGKDRMHVAYTIDCTWPAAQDAHSGVMVAFHGLNHIEKRDLGRGFRQPVSPIPTDRSLHEPSADKISHHLREECDGNALLGGDAPDTLWLRMGRTGQGQHGPDRVIRTPGQFQPHH